MIFRDDITNSLVALRKGGAILYPTDTIWGLGCDATNQSAVENVFRIKSRSESKSLIVLVDGLNMIERYVRDIPDIIYELASVSENPLTIIYPNGRNLSPGICSDDGSVGIRICHDDFCKELIVQFRKPIVSTSANISGTTSPQNFTEIDKSIKNAVDYIVKYRQDDQNKNSPSSIIKIEKNGVLKIIRE